MKKLILSSAKGLLILSAAILISPLSSWAQDSESTSFESEKLISASKEIMEAASYCALITLDASGHPEVRTMDPFSPNEEMIVWLGTNIHSRKVGEIRKDPRVTLYYEDPNGNGYVSIQGNASIVSDPENSKKYWKKEWEAFYPDKNSTFALIKVIPKKLEVINYKHGIVGPSNTWAVPQMEF